MFLYWAFISNFLYLLLFAESMQRKYQILGVSSIEPVILTGSWQRDIFVPWSYRDSVFQDILFLISKLICRSVSLSLHLVYKNHLIGPFPERMRRSSHLQLLPKMDQWISKFRYIAHIYILHQDCLDLMEIWRMLSLQWPQTGIWETDSILAAAFLTCL